MATVDRNDRSQLWRKSFERLQREAVHGVVPVDGEYRKRPGWCDSFAEEVFAGEQSAVVSKSCPEPARTGLVSDVSVDLRLREGFFAEDEVSESEGTEELLLLPGNQQLRKRRRHEAEVPEARKQVLQAEP